MVKHIVEFKFKGTKEQRDEISHKFKRALNQLPSLIDALKEIEVGININPVETWDLVLIATLPSLEAVSIYANHPAHIEATKIIKDHVAERACVDFVTE